MADRTVFDDWALDHLRGHHAGVVDWDACRSRAFWRLHWGLDHTRAGHTHRKGGPWLGCIVVPRGSAPEIPYIPYPDGAPTREMRHV